MRALKILSVCGSGTVTSSMVANKVKDMLKERGYNSTTVETNPGGVENNLDMGGFDLIVYTSPLKKKDYGIPVINAIALITGMGEEEFEEELDAFVATLG